jgi:hypothetical protein
MRRAVGIGLVVAVVALAAPRLDAYLRLGGATFKWTNTIHYFVTNRDVQGVTAVQLQTAVNNGFNTWFAAMPATLAAQFTGFTGSQPDTDDGISVIGFESRPDLSRVLGETTFEMDASSGAILAADIFLNSAQPWSVANGGEAGRFDVQSIATHELGHFLGLGHSALGETQLQGNGGRLVLGKGAVMFPIAFPPGNVADRALDPDDIAGITEIYSTLSSTRATGAISGHVTLNGAGVFGAHVTAFDSRTGALVGAFSLDDKGSFLIESLKPGLYLVRVEPLDDADLDSFFNNDAPVNINFSPMYYAQLVAVPAGGAGPTIEIQVRSK